MTECTQERSSFAAHFSRRVESGFTTGQVSSDGGALLLRQLDRKIYLLRRLAGCFTDGRSPLNLGQESDQMGADATMHVGLASDCQICINNLLSYSVNGFSVDLN